MPSSAPTPCRYPGCAAVLATPGYCKQHKSEQHKDYGRMRRGFDTESTFYQSKAWREVRAAFLRLHPLCCRCESEDELVPAKVGDHIKPLKLGGARFDTENLQALCVPCHNRKSMRERISERNAYQSEI